MPEAMRLLSDDNFRSTVDAKGVTVVYFFSPTCPNCRRLSPVMDRLAQAYAGKVHFGKIDTEANVLTAANLLVMSLPTVFLYRDGQQVERIVSVQPEKVYREKLDKLIAA
ncbi:MAG: thioredoxin family protein [Deinococcus sp.]|nr:thioredoxin family protein [Deinococcus sp.]